MGYLTGPVNSLTDYQVEFNGFLMGPGTSYDIPPVWNFLDLAALKTMDQARVWADGSWSGPDFADVLLPSMAVEVKGATAALFTSAVQALQAAFAPNYVPVPLWVKLPGMPAMGIPAKTNKRTIPIDLTWNGNFSQAAVQWRCPDPTWQSVPRSIVLTKLPKMAKTCGTRKSCSQPLWLQWSARMKSALSPACSRRVAHTR